MRECVLYDLNRRLKRTIEIGREAGPPAELTEIECNRIRNLMIDCLRDAIATVSPEAKLHPPQSDFGSVAEGNFDVYEKTWAPRTGDSSFRRGWRVYLDPTTGLPQRTEFYIERRGAMRGETYWELQRTTVFTVVSPDDWSFRSGLVDTHGRCQRSVKPRVGGPGARRCDQSKIFAARISSVRIAGFAAGEI